LELGKKMEKRQDKLEKKIFKSRKVVGLRKEKIER